MPRNTLQKSVLLSGILTLAIFIVDLITPLGISDSTLYIFVILASLWSGNRRVVYGAIILCTVLTVVGYYLSPESPEPWKAILNRIFAIFAFVIVGLIGLMRIQSQENLKESEKRYSSVLDSLMEGAQIIGFDWRYLYVNEAVALQGQQTRENLLGRTMMEVYPGIEQSDLYQILQRCMQDRLPHLMENEFTHADGTTGWFELNIQPVKEGLFILSNDITVRKRAETNLRQINIELEQRITERMALLQALMDNIPDTIYFKDTASRFTRINAAQAQVLGVATAEDAIGKTDLDFFQDSELTRSFYKEEQRIFTTGEPVINRPEFNPTPDGRPRWFSATKVPIRNSDGQVTGLVGVSRDITKIKQVEEALRQSEERFRLVTWATTDVVWDLDLETDQILWGSGLQKVFKYASEIVQTDQEWWLDHIHEEDRVKVDHTFRQALDAGMEFWSKEYRFQRADGTYADVIDRGYILREDTGRPYRVIGSIMDITERRQAEETIRRQNEMLSSLHQITLDLLKVREIDPLLNTLVKLASDFLDAPYAEIMQVEGETLVVNAVTENVSHLLGERAGRQDAMLSWQAFDTRKPVVLDDYSNWPHRRDVYSKFSLRAVAEFPILDDQQCLGVLSFGRDKPDYEFDSDQIQFGSLFANLTALVLNNAQLREALREQSIRDSLTGLYNRRYMEEALNREIKRATRHSHPLGIIMIDVDHFKRFNDTFGHAIGDKLLRELGRYLQGHVRGEDIACRYGGEEFILIMPDTKQETVRQRAEQLCLGATGINVNTNSQAYPEITLSLGVAMYPQHGRSIEEIIDAADAALYIAKQGGRNQVAVAVKP